MDDRRIHFASAVADCIGEAIVSTPVRVGGVGQLVIGGVTRRAVLVAGDRPARRLGERVQKKRFTASMRIIPQNIDRYRCIFWSRVAVINRVWRNILHRGQSTS